MFLIPFGQTHKSYTIPDVKDTSAQEEFKRWIKEGISRRELLDQIHEETMREYGELE